MQSNSICTDRLEMRPFTLEDAELLFSLDSDPEVMRYLGNKPINDINVVHEYLGNILRQYQENNIARWAVLEKSSGQFIGWAGIKYITEEENGMTNFYDVGYRLLPAFWGKGYATECTKAWIDYAKHKLKIQKIYASAHVDNHGSQKVLIKSGFLQTGQYDFSFNGATLPCYWYELRLEKDI